MNKTISFWLYYNDNPIYAVRMPEGTPDQDVRTRALMQHDRVPLCYPASRLRKRNGTWDRYS